MKLVDRGGVRLIEPSEHKLGEVGGKLELELPRGSSPNSEKQVVPGPSEQSRVGVIFTVESRKGQEKVECSF
jgi:hypothetical protein